MEELNKILFTGCILLLFISCANTNKQFDKKEEKSVIISNNTCFDSIFQAIKADKYLSLLSDISDYKEVLNRKEIDNWMSRADTSSMTVYKLADNTGHDYLIFCASQWAGTGIGSSFYIWLLIDMVTGYSTSNMSMSKNQHSFYIQNHNLYFVQLGYGNDFYANRDQYYSDSLFSIEVKTNLLNKESSEFKLEKVSSYEINCPDIME